MTAAGGTRRRTETAAPACMTLRVTHRVDDALRHAFLDLDGVHASPSPGLAVCGLLDAASPAAVAVPARAPVRARSLGSLVPCPWRAADRTRRCPAVVRSLDGRCTLVCLLGNSGAFLLFSASSSSFFVAERAGQRVGSPIVLYCMSCFGLRWWWLLLSPTVRQQVQ